ncbi:PDZ domain-containing protein [Schlesneria paludicola]|uniref:tetratricopeptide repeat protein n=1 Tax=Schlesneria paludicola TaxID=360056 RepID=UPI00029A915D|nr:tetratricopeptide repeat protein [Schlesneria paludicola]
MWISRIAWIVFITTYSGVHAADVDPLVWNKPAEAPVFRNQLPPDIFQQRSRMVLERLGDLSKLTASPIPDRGVRITRVLPDSQAITWNLKPDDLITKIDSIELWGGSLPNTTAQRKVTIFRCAENRSQTMKAEPGKIGILTGLHWRPELTYLRNKSSRNPKWDEFVVVGAHSCQSDPDLAETAWFHAVEAGYRPDGLSWICGAAIALEQGRVEAAADFAYLAHEVEPKRAKIVSPCVLLRVMLANYKFSDAFELCRQYPEELCNMPRAYQLLADLHRARSDDERRARPPSQISEEYYRNDLMPRCVPMTIDARTDLPKLLEGNGLTASEANGFHRPLVFVPSDPARNLELTVRYTPITMHAGVDESYFTVALVPYSPENATQLLDVADALAIGVSSLEGSRIALRQGIPASATIFDASGTSSAQITSQEIRVIRVRGQLEAFVNGKRWLYQPVADEKMGPSGFIVGRG